MEHLQQAIESGEALPRDISRFKRLYPNGRANIKENADATLSYLSTAELVIEVKRAA